MSTPNFSLKNASRFFVFGMPVYYTQEDIDENELDQNLLGMYDELETEANYEADKANVAGELKAKGWHDIEECDGDRSYPTTLFSEKTKTICFGDTEVYVTMQAGCTFLAFNGEAGYSKIGKRLWQEVEEQNKKTA